MLLLFSLALLVGLGPGYVLWLRCRSRALHPVSAPVASVVWPHLAVIVPVHNESSGISDKIRNLRALRYQRDRLRIWFVDGASTDGTPEAIAEGIGRDPRFKLLREPFADKTAQLNVVLRRVSGEWVMVTDADARLLPDTLEKMVSAGEVNAGLWVIGTPVTPAHAHPLERLHWQISNYFRRAESACGSASIVAGPCYLFRRRLLDQFPADVIADDLHVSFAASAAGYRVGFVEAPVIEVRSPVDLGGLLRHKIRKCDAYLREIFRFLPRVRRMKSPARQVFLWRAAQFVVAPVAAAAIGAAAIATIDSMPWPAYIAAGALATLLAAGAWLRWPYVSAVASLVVLTALLAVALLLALLWFPFSRQTACYPKVVVGWSPGQRR